MTTTTSATSGNSVLQSYLDKQSSTISSSASSSSSSSSSGIFNNENTFLTILTTQLKHQDPTASTDTNQFTQELVQFAQVEQQLNTNKYLDQLVSLQKSSSSSSVIGYMGQYVETPTTTGQLSLQSGSAELGYTLPSTASKVTVTIKDSSGNTVQTLSGSTTKGLNYLTWDGTDSSGNQLSDGAYSFTVSATDTSGTAETISDTRMVGKVTGITTSGSTVSLSFGSSVSAELSTVDAVFGTSASNRPSSGASSSSSTSSSS